jgi:hypothetical protein
MCSLKCHTLHSQKATKSSIYGLLWHTLGDWQTMDSKLTCKWNEHHVQVLSTYVSCQGSPSSRSATLIHLSVPTPQANATTAFEQAITISSLILSSSPFATLHHTTLNAIQSLKLLCHNTATRPGLSHIYGLLGQFHNVTVWLGATST